MPRLKYPITTVALLALAAGANLRLRPRWRSTRAPPATGDDGREGRRQMRVHRSRRESRIWREIEGMGIEPGTGAFERKLQRKMGQREKMKRMKRDRARRQATRELLREKRDVWVRGNFLRVRGSDELVSNYGGRDEEIQAAADMEAEMEQRKIFESFEEDYQPLIVCGRPADAGSAEDFSDLQKYAQCPEITQDKPILLLEEKKGFGRTGNRLIEFLHATQEARDQEIQLGIFYHSWAMDLLTKTWMAIDDDDWEARFERAFCVKIFYNEDQLEGWDIIRQDAKELFYYRSNTPLGEYMASQEHAIRAFFRNYDYRDGHDLRNNKVQDICSGIDAMFGGDPSSAIYSVIHSRSQEGEPGFRLLGNMARRSGCDPVAALEMRPDYVRSILEPLGMMDYPIVFIWDGQNPEVLERLMADPDIGPLIRVVPEEASWIGGDITLAVMSNVFIGNPASSFSGFIAKSRLALGFGHNYLFRAKDENGAWRTVCGDHCIFDKSIIGIMS